MDPKLAAQFVLTFSAFIGLLCLYGFIFPKQLVNVVTAFWNKKMAFYLAILIRLLFGISLIFAAPVSKYENLFNFLGFITILAAILILILGRKKIGMVLQWATNWPLLGLRAWLMFGLAFCGFLISSLM
jgi:hypothetical protein